MRLRALERTLDCRGAEGEMGHSWWESGGQGWHKMGKNMKCRMSRRHRCLLRPSTWEALETQREDKVAVLRVVGGLAGVWTSQHAASRQRDRL